MPRKTAARGAYANGLIVVLARHSHLVYESMAVHVAIGQREGCESRFAYSESHDEAGNATASRRTILAAVDVAPLVGGTRRVAEARTGFAAGMALLAPGTPMFLMGEELGALKPDTYDRFAENKEEPAALRKGTGAWAAGERSAPTHQVAANDRRPRSRRLGLAHRGGAPISVASIQRWTASGR